MKKCPYCAEDIQDDAIVCKHCGKDLKNKKTTSKKIRNFAIALPISFLVVCVCLSVAVFVMPEKEERVQILEPTQTPIQTPTPAIDNNIKVIMDEVGLTEIDAERAFEVLKSVGVERVEKFTFFKETGTLKAYIASLGYTKEFLVTFDGNEIFGISLDATVFYDRDAGGVLDQIKNYVLDETEKSTFIYLAQENVKQFLKAPATAEFPSVIFSLDQWRIIRKKDIVWVQSWVDAENSFGAKLRNQFTAQYSYSSQQLIYLELDGEPVYGSPQNP